MRGSMETVPPMLAEYAKRRKRIVEGLREIPGVTCEWPGGAFRFPNISAHLQGGHALAKSCTELSQNSSRRLMSRWCRARLSGLPAFCACLTQLP